mmetsp:Transcript_13800/g.20950  ORF Transcript_13800/g.20950 Transcript_13800/m.20950 type:complete len:332 (+) Transcript_13800:88-1083(+)|eukprot:CAMPEP_0203680746 /NCGR_PEP_ID=MMETSP0090-20130426/40462_1 /ASSEMBLY_ACC=CAM_ASM_001088 /TAXON_ID=426623 /ORGANISM="Chaetoceros affinis, Strain CCMP159" /LENGTH=331 /DNA_ID=CAMNT_0050548963 /DNA_START=69 /DNA_END=1064 /DNA_ORIENTATION=+
MDQNQQQSKEHEMIIRREILQIMSKMDSNVRPNKLRKIVCKNVSGATWTQFQNVLDTMVNVNTSASTSAEGKAIGGGGGVLGGSGGDKDKVLQTIMVDNELMICPIRSSTSSSSTKSDESPSDNNDKVKKNSITMDIDVPLAIVFHLTKKGRSKQKSLEQNSKTQLQFSKEAVRIVKRGRKSMKNGTSAPENNREEFCFDPSEITTITIRSLASPTLQGTDVVGEKNDHDHEILAKKYLKTAKVMIDQMIKAFHQHPDHFYPKKAGGGTFEEQNLAKAKKKKLQTSLNRSRSRNGNSKKWNGNDDGNTTSSFSKNDQPSSVRTKKRQRKFY